jgi:glycosyltransferase involved in cell wall biosynthesis
MKQAVQNDTRIAGPRRITGFTKTNGNEQRFKLVRITTVPSSLAILLRNQLRFMSAHFEVIAVSSPGEELTDVGKQEGVSTASISMQRAITPLQDLVALWKLYRLFRKEQPAIVHTHTPKAGLLGMMAAWLARVPVRLHTVAGMPLMETTGWKRKLLEWAERITSSCATMVYPNSKNLAFFMLKNKYCHGAKLKVLGNGSSNGIDMEYFSLSPAITAQANALRSKWGVRHSDFVYVFVGRLVKEKGIAELVAAFMQLRKKYTGIKLLLVGPYEQQRDPLPDDVLETIRTDPHIIHTGFVKDIRPYLAMSHVLTFPSYREGFPNAPLQAGCLHIPAIVTDINGCNEIIEHMHNGLLIPPRQMPALEYAMKKLLTDHQLYLSLRANAREAVRTRYDQRQFWNLLLDEYRLQLKNHHLVPKTV